MAIFPSASRNRRDDSLVPKGGDFLEGEPSARGAGTIDMGRGAVRSATARTGVLFLPIQLPPMTEKRVSSGCFLRSQINHPRMEAMRATWAHTWLCFKMQLGRCRDAAMEQLGSPFSCRFVRSTKASHFPAPLQHGGDCI